MFANNPPVLADRNAIGIGVDLPRKAGELF